MRLYNLERGARRALAFTLFLFSLGGTPATGFAELLTPSAQPAPDVVRAAPTDPAVIRQRPVTVDVDYLAKQVEAAAPVKIELFDGQSILIDVQRLQNRRPGNFSHFGKVRGNADSATQLTVVDGFLSGIIEVRRSKGRPSLYRIESYGDAAHWLQEIDPDAFPADHAPGDQAMITPVESKSLVEGPQPDLATAGAVTTIDVMVVYTSNVATAAGAAIGSQIQAAVDSANKVYANSGIPITLRLVHYAQVAYADSGNFTTDLNRLTSASDGYFDNVHTLRNTYGADLVSMFVETGSACGIGWLNSTASYGFTVVKRSCATGNYSFVHELGHNMGARHDAYVDAATTPFAYGHGMVDLVARWRTVMSYSDSCAAAGVSCPRIPYVSNPNVVYGASASPTGTTATSNNARVLTDRAATVAAFRTASTGGCSYALSPSALSVASAGGNASTTVTSGTGCAWNLSSNASWLSVSSSSSSGNGTLGVSAAANTGAARSASVTVGDQTLTVSQPAACSYTVSPTSISASAAGGNGTLTVTTTTGCAWTATSSAAWATIASGASGTGNGTVSYAVGANAGSARSGNLSVAGKTVIISQATGATTTSATLTPAQLDFRSTLVGKRGDTLAGTFTNTGTTTLTLSIASGGANIGDFSASGTCTSGRTLAAGQSCTLQYTFVPTASGARTASVDVSTAAGVRTLTLNGYGKIRGK